MQFRYAVRSLAFFAVAANAGFLAPPVRDLPYGFSPGAGSGTLQKAKAAISGLSWIWRRAAQQASNDAPQNKAIPATESQAFVLGVPAANATTEVQARENATVPVASSPEVVKKRRRVTREGSLIESLRHLENGKEATGCVMECRYGEERQPWRVCLDKCVENPLMRSTLVSMLPAEDHAAPAAHVEAPHWIEVPEETRRRLERARKRSAEL
eukprot:TRINITY_DN73285_c0_g1_i1.p1 TRINITY_DN73285_c0_g1~~TRINITY_DN73285_c0_g1_i1.p1  ORF type:complete len:212 (-),score=46.13 TRINITY_DN73285_c0_g1_i1:73-708(-)